MTTGIENMYARLIISWRADVNRYVRSAQRVLSEKKCRVRFVMIRAKIKSGIVCRGCIFRVDEKGAFIPRRESKREKMFPITTIRGNKWSKQDRLTGSMTEKRGIEELLCWGWMKGVNKR